MSYATAQDWLNGAKEQAERALGRRAPAPVPEPVSREASDVQQSVPSARAEQLAKLRDRRRVYIEYARHRIDDEDWHGVSDAANNLRELDVEIRMLEDRR